MPTLQDAVVDLHRIVVVEGKSQAPNRLSLLADVCVAELAVRGLVGARAEVVIPAGGRDKAWDVGWEWAGKYRLVLSLKSILKNIRGTVPNRIDDAMGETASIQLYSPEIVTGYVMIFDTASDAHSEKKGGTWLEFLSSRLDVLSGRRAPYWSPGTFESHAVVAVDFSAGPSVVGGEDAFVRMFDELVSETKRRNPGIEGGADG